MPPKTKEYDVTRWKGICSKDDEIQNHTDEAKQGRQQDPKYHIVEAKWNKEAKQKNDYPQYHTDEANHNKTAMQLIWQDSKYHADEARQNKEAVHKYDETLNAIQMKQSQINS